MKFIWYQTPTIAQIKSQNKKKTKEYSKICCYLNNYFKENYVSRITKRYLRLFKDGVRDEKSMRYEDIKLNDKVQITENERVWESTQTKQIIWHWI